MYFQLERDLASRAVAQLLLVRCKHSLPSTMINRIAACSCGQLNATVTEAPIRVSICHCTDCQRRTGSVFATQARFPKDAVKIAGSSTQYIRLDDEGRKKATFHFCPHCSAILYWQLEAEEGMILIPVGAFADPGFPTPTVSVWEEDKHAWVSLPENIEHW